MEQSRPQGAEPASLPEAPAVRRPQSRMALFVDISMGAIGGVIVAFVLLTLADLLGLTEAEPSAFLFLGAALAGALAGVIVGLSYRDWLFLRVFELRVFYLDLFDIWPPFAWSGVLFAWIFAGLIALVEAVWVVVLAFVWLVRMLGRGLRKLFAP